MGGETLVWYMPLVQSHTSRGRDKNRAGLIPGLRATPVLLEMGRVQHAVCSKPPQNEAACRCSRATALARSAATQAPPRFAGWRAGYPQGYSGARRRTLGTYSEADVAASCW